MLKRRVSEEEQEDLENNDISVVDVFAHVSQAPDCHTLLYPVMGFSCPCFCPYELPGHR